MGRVTAAFTHEMKNVLAIIKESGGLMEDLLLMSRDVPFPHRERFMRALTSVQDQVRRGVELSSRLNGFAHSPDQCEAVVDLNDIAQQVAGLSQRPARLKGVEVRVDPASEAPQLLISSIRLQMAVFVAMECCWNQMSKGGTVRLRPEKRPGEVVVEIFCEGDLGERDDFVDRVTGSSQWEMLREIMTGLGGKIEWSLSGFSFFVILPSRGEE